MSFHRFTGIPLLGLLLFATVQAQSASETLADLQWKHRIILVNASGPSQAETAVETLRSARGEVEDRDILWFVVTDNSLASNRPDPGKAMERSVRETLTSRSGGQSVILIGKDGGVKDRSESLDLERIFSVIDRMPMRVREMRQKQEEGG
ncbi:MAG: DUF4174 domain-containing protein [Oleiphilaceae bacterium]|nr:DUF4174 domain-containing protein [Oleiphilaceae bacterium]